MNDMKLLAKFIFNIINLPPFVMVGNTAFLLINSLNLVDTFVVCDGTVP